MSVTVVQSGAAPTELETQVTRLIEDAVAGLDHRAQQLDRVGRIDALAVQAVAEASYVYTTTKSKAEARSLVRVVIAVAALVSLGTLVPRPLTSPAAASAGFGSQILLLANPIHTDIALPLDDQVRAAFADLIPSGVPIDMPGVEYLVIGWGGRSFYIETPNWGDIRPLPVLERRIGDHRKEDPQQLVVTDHRRVIGDLHGFGVVGHARDDHIILRACRVAAVEAGNGRGDALDVAEHAFDAPETATGKDRGLEPRRFLGLTCGGNLLGRCVADVVLPLGFQAHPAAETFTDRLGQLFEPLGGGQRLVARFQQQCPVEAISLAERSMFGETAQHALDGQAGDQFGPPHGVVLRR